MDSTLAPAEAPTARSRPSQLVLHTAIYPSATNPRSRFDEASIKELAASMAPPVGIIEPLVVRPHPSKPAGTYEIVAGERRWRAAKLADIRDVPVIVRDLDDAQVLDLQLIENKHRDDIHPLDEAHAMERRIKLDRQLTPKSMARFIGVSERYVQNRLRYLTLVIEAQQAFLNGEILAAHADLLIRLPADGQKRAMKDGLFAVRWDHEAQKNVKELRSARYFDDWLRENIRIKPLEAAQSGLFPELQKELIVVDGEALDASGQPAVLVELTEAWTYQPAKKEQPPFPLGASRWKEVKAGEKCDHQVRGVVVIGRGQGKILTVCIGYGKCKKHHMASVIEQEIRERPTTGHAKSTPAKKSKAELHYEQQHAVRRAEEKLWTKLEKSIRGVLVKAARAAKPGPKLFQYLGQRFGAGSKAKTLGDIVVAAVDELYSLGEARDAAKILGADIESLVKAAAPKKAKPAKKLVVKKAPKKIPGGRKKR